ASVARGSWAIKVSFGLDTAILVSRGGVVYGLTMAGRGVCVRKAETSMLPSLVQDLTAFLPARDYTLAKQFYIDLGFTLNWSRDRIAEFAAGSFHLFLTPFYVKEHAENFMMSLAVDDADLWWQHIERIGLAEKYPGIMARPPAMQPWGVRVLYVSDPTG